MEGIFHKRRETSFCEMKLCIAFNQLAGPISYNSTCLSNL